MVFFDYMPVNPVRITSKYGKRNTGIKGASTFHKGIDLGANRRLPETPIFSVCSGVVTKNEFHSVRGYYIVIKHDEKYSTLYQHLKSKPALKIGEHIKAGQQIGIMGNTSAKLTIATHLHFELWENGQPIDPQPYLEGKKMTESEMRKIIREELANANQPVSAWAKKDWQDATAQGIVDGTNPKGYVTREQLAAVIMRVLTK